MKREVYDCDRCNKADLPAVIRTFIVTGRSTTPAGDSDDDGEHVDLCQKCRAEAFAKFVLARRDYALNAEVLRGVKERS